jgi:phosphate transport system substrate-binding protein
LAALHNDTEGCIDIARSSSDSNPGGLDMFAFAEDAVSWAGFRSLKCPHTKVPCTPGNLSQKNLKDIYLCTRPDPTHPGQKKPVDTKWSQVMAGLPATNIVRVLPQAGSGTLTFFEQTILGLAPTDAGVKDDTSCGTPAVRVQVNSGQAASAALGNNKAKMAAAIVPYSLAQWQSQASGVVPDSRAGVALGKINHVSPTVATIQNGSFLGRRWVFNAINPGSPSFNAAERFVGASDAANDNGFICSGAGATVIQQFGFVPLPVAPLFPGSSNVTSRCRLNAHNPPT